MTVSCDSSVSARPGGAVGLADRLGDVLRVVGGAAQVDAVGGEVHRPQLDVRLLEEPVRG